MERNRSIDLIKVLAMLGVVSLHSNLGRTDTFFGFCMSRAAGISIPLFFIVSGYLMASKQKITTKYSFLKIYKILKYVVITGILYVIINYSDLYIEGQEKALGKLLDYKTYTNTIFSSLILAGPMGFYWFFGAQMLLYPFMDILIRNRKKLFLLSFFTGTVFFALDIYNTFENTYIIYPLCVWYWVMYFTLGAILKRDEVNIPIHINLRMILCVMMFFLIFVYLLTPYNGVIGYYFGSIPCLIYAFVVFKYIISKNINLKILGELSKYFLPVYTIHSFIIIGQRHHLTTDFLGFFSPLADYAINVTISLCIAFILVRIPYVKNIFKL